ncbi:MAG: MFS transporter [Euryarchaeota archaeon]|nr:MFS transporter [Euryarchaeota archaeon]
MNSDSTDSGGTPQKVALNFTIGILAFAMFLVIYTQGVMAPVLPTLQAEFATTETWAAWTITIYSVVGIVALPIFGKLGDMYGKKKFFVIGMGIYAFSLVLSALAWNLSSFILFRALSGLGLATFPLSYGLIRDEFPAQRIAPSLGILTGAVGVGAALGVLAGGVLTQFYGWRSCFSTLAPIAIALVLLAVYKLEESSLRAHEKLDLAGAAAISIALLSFLVAMSQGGIWGWISAYTIGLLIVSLIFSVLFVAIELRVTDPMLQLKIFRSRTIFCTLITAVTVGISTYTMLQVVPYALRYPAPVGLGLNSLETGVVMFPGGLLIVFLGPLAGILVNRWGGKTPLVIGTVAMALGFVAFYMFNSTWLEILLDKMFVSIGIAFSYSAMAAIIVHSLPRSQTGVGSGVYTVMRSLGNVIGPTISAAFLLTYRAPIPISTPRGISMVSFPTQAAFDYVYLASLGIALIGVVASLLIRGDVAKIKQPVKGETTATTA